MQGPGCTVLAGRKRLKKKQKLVADEPSHDAPRDKREGEAPVGSVGWLHESGDEAGPEGSSGRFGSALPVQAGVPCDRINAQIKVGALSSSLLITKRHKRTRPTRRRTTEAIVPQVCATLHFSCTLTACDVDVGGPGKECAWDGGGVRCAVGQTFLRNGE